MSRSDERTEADRDAGSGDVGPNADDPNAAGRPQPIWALRGAFTFLTRLPIPNRSARDWDAFRRSAWTFPVVGAVVGAVAGVAFSLPVPWPTAVVLYLVALSLLTGVTHPDGLADVGDAIAAHDPERRREVLKDSSTGVGGTLALVLVFVATAFGAVGLASTAAGMGVALRIALAAEVGAKLGMALLVCFGDSAHDGLGSQLTDAVGPASVIPAVAIAGTVLLAPPTGALPALVAALAAGPVVAVVVLLRARSWLGGVNGDLMGATNEVGRALALHAGVVVWALL